MNGGMLCFGSITLSHSTNRGGSVGFRDDVGIVPYERDGVRSVQRTGAVSWENFYGHYLFLVVIRYTI